MKKNILAILLLVYSVFGGGLFDLLDKPEPKPEPVVEILNIDRPSDEVINRVKEFSDLITDPNDRAKIAIFNHEFATRIIDYSTTSQQINDVYALAGKLFFKQTLVDKYDGLAEKIVDLLEEILSDKNHSVSIGEKMELNKYFMGVAWVLTHRG